MQESHLEATTAFRYDHAANLETLWLSESLAQIGVFPATLKATCTVFGRYANCRGFVLCALIRHRQGKGCWAPFATSAAAAWYRRIPHQFSLRTLLIATTLIAVVLGLVVYAVRN